MKKYILCFDSLGKTSLEIARIFDTTEIKVINTVDYESIEKKVKDLGDKLKLVVWSVYTEKTAIFNDIIKLKKSNEFRHIPLIVISNVSKNDFVLKAIQAGANDFIIRPYNDFFLKNKINDILSLNRKSNFINLNEVTEKVEFSFREIISVHIKGASRGKYDVSMVMLSLEKSRELDIKIQQQIIEIIQKILEKSARETDLIIKYNKNNILMVLPYTDSKGVKFFYNKILDILLESNILKKEARGAIISASYNTLSNDVSNNHDDIIIKKLQSKLKVCMAIPNLN